MPTYETPFLLVAAESRITELTKALIRIGLDNIAGYVTDMDRIGDAGHPIRVLEQITVDELNEKRERYHVLDVRGETEHLAGHIPGSLHVHAGYLADALEQLPRDEMLAVHCVSGDRSSIASSYLLSKGFTNVRNLTCGFNGWKQRGYEVVHGRVPAEQAV
jgi:hydroxyacylglutathione hydrolase